MWGVVSLGSTTHSSWEREQNDFYATNPIAIKLLLEQEKNCFWKILLKLFMSVQEEWIVWKTEILIDIVALL